jgi:lon-related putative ATP-dependent protease
MKTTKPLHYKHLRQKLNPKHLGFETTAELETLSEFIGQERALEALSFGIGIQSQGYNLYAMGPAGIGKHSVIRSILEDTAIKKEAPSDWCYIYNFEVPEKPISLELPPGLGNALQQDMKSFIEKLSASILDVFESDEYSVEMRKITDTFNASREKFTKKIMKKNSKNDPTPNLYKERHKKEKALKYRFTSAVVEPIIQELKNKYIELPRVLKYLSSVQKDVIDHVDDIIKSDESTSLFFFAQESPVLLKYQVNLLVDNSKRKGAPILFEENPSYSNLICQVEHVPQLGTLVTNFTLIRPGALHKANGGYLVIEARNLQKEPHAWEGLKRALYSRKIKIVPVEHLTETVRPISLEPTPIPLNIKVILLGDRHTFYALSNHDPDFGELFKVAVDFDEQIARTKINLQLYARLIATIVRKENLRPFLASAVARVIDYSTRIAQDIKKLSTHVRSINDLILEADYWASLSNKRFVEAVDVKRAIDAKIHRLDRTRELYYEDIFRDFIAIKTEGSLIGQVNCLSVVKVGKFSFGHPTRMTGKVRMGKAQIIDIQREINMAGPIMSKGSLIISHFLASRYNTNHLFSLSASLAFEQIYGEMDGDSASVAEVCVLMSALAEIPIKQNFALTGSVNQYGDVQAIGGVNEKIEGFFDICKGRGLTGDQAVLIPTVNAKNLMLREDVVQATKDHLFSIYLIDTVDDAISLLTDVPAGKLLSEDKYTPDSVNDRVAKRLLTFSQTYSREKKGQN